MGLSKEQLKDLEKMIGEHEERVKDNILCSDCIELHKEGECKEGYIQKN